MISNNNNNNNFNNKIIKNILLKYKQILKDLNFETYGLDVELLLISATNLSRTELYLNISYELSDKEFEVFEKNFNRRLKKEPIAYILGKWEFMGLEFLLNNDTLIPRPETEVLVEKALEIINKNIKNNYNILDLCTGSGAIAVSMASYINNSFNIFASDINQKALDIAVKNAKLNNINNINFVKSDLFNNINNIKFDLIVSNPPYIKTSDISTLEDNVKNYEPMLALDGGKSGLVFYEKIISQASNYLNNNAYLIFEIGYNQANDISNLLENYNFENIQVIKDLAGFDRIIISNYKIK